MLIFLTLLLSLCSAAVVDKLLYVESISYGGSACPQGSISHTLSLTTSDRAKLILEFESLEIIADSSSPKSYKSCELNLKIAYSKSLQLSLRNVVYRGQAQLSPGANAVCATSYYFSGLQHQATSTSSFKGPLESPFSINDDITGNDSLWSQCGQYTTLSMRVASQITAQSESSTQISEVEVGIEWQLCQAK